MRVETKVAASFWIWVSQSVFVWGRYGMLEFVLNLWVGLNLSLVWFRRLYLFQFYVWLKEYVQVG